MRAFVGLILPDAALDALERVQGALSVGRQVPEENMHLTLAFLDDQPEATLHALHQALSDIPALPVPLMFQGLETYGGRHPRGLAAAAQKTPELSALRDKVRQACRLAEIDLPRERFRPHVTLARFPRHLEAGQEQKIARFLAGAAGFRLDCLTASMALFQSTLSPDGARYDVLAEYPLGA